MPAAAQSTQYGHTHKPGKNPAVTYKDAKSDEPEPARAPSPPARRATRNMDPRERRRLEREQRGRGAHDQDGGSLLSGIGDFGRDAAVDKQVPPGLPGHTVDKAHSDDTGSVGSGLVQNELERYRARREHVMRTLEAFEAKAEAAKKELSCVDAILESLETAMPLLTELEMYEVATC